MSMDASPCLGYLLGLDCDSLFEKTSLHIVFMGSLPGRPSPTNSNYTTFRTFLNCMCFTPIVWWNHSTACLEEKIKKKFCGAGSLVLKGLEIEAPRW